MELNFNYLSKTNNDEEYIINLKNVFPKNFHDKDILVVNVHEKIILWMLENSFRNNSGLSILQYDAKDSLLDQIIQKNKFRYLFFPKSCLLDISMNFSEIFSLNIYETEVLWDFARNNEI